MTSTGGEAVVEALVPLLRGGAIDERRMTVIRARIAQNMATESARAVRAGLLARAARAWFKWAVLGHKVRIYGELVELGVRRRELLGYNVETGAIAPIEVTDNDRLIAARRAAFTRLGLEYRRAELELGLYRRGASGRPETPRPGELPKTLPAPSLVGDDVVGAFAKELDRAPELQMLSQAIELLSKEEKAAKNDALPRVDFSVFAAQSFGEERPYAPFASSITETRVGGTLSLELDVQRRKALGKRDAFAAKQKASLEKQRLLEDSLRASLEAQLAALRAEAEATLHSEEAMRHAGLLAEAEREELSLGQSSVLEVNLREEAVLNAELLRLDSLLGFHMAWVELGQLVGSDDVRRYLPPGSSTP